MSQTEMANPKHNFVYVACYNKFDNLAHAPSGTPAKIGMRIYKFADGELTQVGTDNSSFNPAFIRFHTNEKILYTCSESITENDHLFSYSINPKDGSLTPLTEPVPLEGKSACYLTLDPQQSHIMFINYWDSTLGSVALDKDGTPAKKVKGFVEAEPKKELVAQERSHHLHNRQSESHAHALVLERSGRMAFVPDLGRDIIRQFVFNPEDGSFTPSGHTKIKGDGAQGPRYLEFHPNPVIPLAYVVNELSSTVNVYKVDHDLIQKVVGQGGKYDGPMLEFIRSYSTVPENCPAKNTCGRIAISPCGNYLVVSNRGHDSLTTFRLLKDGTLKHMQTLSSGGRTPRHFKFAPCGNYCLAANQDSDNVTVFGFDKETGKMDKIQTVEVNSPNFIGCLGENLGTMRHCVLSRSR